MQIYDAAGIMRRCDFMRFLSERGNDELEDGEGDLSVDDHDHIQTVSLRSFVHCRNDQQTTSERDRAANRYAPC